MSAADMGLRRPNFILDPRTDSDACFARDDVKPGDLVRTLQIDLVTELAPKKIFWGPYGAGKTHTLYRTVHELEKLTKVFPVHVECPNMERKSNFNDFYRDGIMSAMGSGLVVGLLEEYVETKPPKKPDIQLELIRDELHDESLANAVLCLFNPKFPRLTFWSWISGFPLKANDLRELGQTQDLTGAEPAYLATILVTIGEVLRRIRHLTLVLVLDELERLSELGAEGLNTMMTGFTRLADQNQTSVAVLLGVSAKQLTNMPDIFAGNSPVMSRITSEGLIKIPPMEDSDVDSFIRRIIAFVRDPEFNIADAVTAASQATPGETFTFDFFPFSDEALEAMKQSLSSENTPREITYKMTRCLGRALLAKHTAITQRSVE
ncbi:MAG TPA: hypothetical protein VGC72_16610 [Candidatus Elarobacter sp.]|jgi:hypothetical protein